MQLSPSNVPEILKSKNYTENLSKIDVNICGEFNFNYWEIEQKLKVKQHNKYLFICENKEIFLDLSTACKNIVVMDEDIDIEDSNFFKREHKDSFKSLTKACV